MRVISGPQIWVISIVTLLISAFITTQEPPSNEDRTWGCMATLNPKPWRPSGVGVGLETQTLKYKLSK